MIGWILLLAVLAGGTSASANTLTVALPPAVKQTLDKEYTGWTFAKPSPEVQKQFASRPSMNQPALVSADFDADGKADYAVQIARLVPGEEEQIVIAFLHRGDAFEEVILESRGIDSNVYLWVRKQKPQGGTSAKDALIVMGGPAGASTYVFDNGAFHEVPSSETDSPAEPE